MWVLFFVQFLFRAEVYTVGVKELNSTKKEEIGRYNFMLNGRMEGWKNEEECYTFANTSTIISNRKPMDGCIC